MTGKCQIKASAICVFSYSYEFYACLSSAVIPFESRSSLEQKAATGSQSLNARPRVPQLDLVGRRNIDSIGITVYDHDSRGDMLSNTQ